MTVPILFLFLTDLSLAQHTNPHSHRLQEKGPGRLNSESAILSDIDDRDTFCKGNVNAVFPDPYAYNVYYRCRRNRRETWKCIGDLYFDWKNQKCAPRLLPQVKVSLTSGVCYQKEDELQPLYTTDCKSYVRCKGGVAVEEEKCGSNESFSYHLQSCRKTSEVTCVQSFCAPNSDGFYIFPGSKCGAYYLCMKGLQLSFLCPRGQAFDLKMKICVDGGICYEPICVGRPDGIYPDTTHNCHRYFTCRSGKLIDVTTCPKSLKHNGFACIPADGVKCDGPEKTAVVIYNRRNEECKFLRDGIYIIPGTDCRKIRICEAARTVGISQCPINYRYNGRECYRKEITNCDDSCSGKQDGYYPDESKDCHEYFYCYNERIRERKKCEAGTSFDGKLCLPSQLVSCRKEEIERCGGLPDGFHADYLNGCRDYFYCHDQQTILKSSCSEGMKWNGNYCTSDFTCDRPASLPQCQGATTGVHQDVSSNCTRYVYCKNGWGTMLSCPKDEVYDGFRCKSPNEYTCPNVLQDECYDQPDGYRQDKKSNCRSYFFCSKGTKITYVCRNDLLFNGTHCVSPESYNCPFNTYDCVGKYNGYYPDKTEACRKYFYCFNDNRLRTITCAGKKIFNGESCILTGDAKVVCLKATSNPCHRRRDGTYRNSCEKYIECRRQEVVQENACPRGTTFNGRDCSTNSLCSSKIGKPFTCNTATTVFTPDYDSGCKRYYFCVKNMKMVASCPVGTIFNGRVCQDEKTYICPAEISDV